MNKKYLKNIFILFIFAISIMFFMPNKVNAEDYTIEEYDIKMIVNEDNSFDITETITAYFNVPKHGIFRKIPLKNKVQRLDGTVSGNIVRITDIDVNENYTSSKSGGYQVLQIGDSNRTLTGSHTYVIKYKYNIGKDPIKDADELYFNLIGDEWDTSIGNVSFTISMPKSFDESTVGFSSGSRGSTSSTGLNYSVENNKIIGTLSNRLKAGEALTVRATLPEGYFVGATSNFDIYSIVVIAFCIISVAIAYMLWAKYGKDDEVIESVEFYPPEGYNSAEVGFLYNGSCDTESVISLLIYLANKGYLKIEESEEKTLFSTSKGFKITKVKEYDGENQSEKEFFDGLFKNKDAVTASDLYDRFYITLNSIKSKINSRENKKKIFESSAGSKGAILILMIIAIILLITVKPIMEYGEPGMLLFALLFPRNRIYCNDKYAIYKKSIYKNFWSCLGITIWWNSLAYYGFTNIINK